jgi:hypothetical protein
MCISMYYFQYTTYLRMQTKYIPNYAEQWDKFDEFHYENGLTQLFLKMKWLNLRELVSSIFVWFQYRLT